jgi:hypothetical protein
MANYEAQITPTGLKQKNLVDLLYMIIAAIKGICVHLDDDTGVTDTDYEALVYTAIFNGSITNSRANSLTNLVTTKADYFGYVTPLGIDDKRLIHLLYDIFDMMETLCEKLDADSLGDSNYEALVYTALYLWTVTNPKGNTLGNGTNFNFNPGGIMNQKELVNLLAAIVNSIDVLTKKLDADGTVNSTDYEATYDTAIILMQIQNSAGSVYGNALTTFNP